MVKHFKISLFTFIFLAVSSLLIAAHSTESFAFKNNNLIGYVMDSDLTVTQTSSTSVLLSWNSWPGSGDYTITVTNLTTHQVEQSFATASLTVAVNNLNAGHTYRFEVEKASYVIAEDVVM